VGALDIFYSFILYIVKWKVNVHVLHHRHHLINLKL
jgi:hypothetical protein